MNSLVIGIGGTGSNIASFIKKQNNPSLEVITIENQDQIEDIKFSKYQNIFTVSALGGESSAEITSLVTQKAKDSGINIKNIVILPFSIETNQQKVINELEKLQSLNQNIELYPNDSISDDKNLSMLQIMHLMDQKVYERIVKEHQIKWKSFFIEQLLENKIYSAFVQYWSKDYKIVLLSPEFKIIEESHMPYMAQSRFALENETDESFIDIKEITLNSLENSVQKLKLG